MIMNKRAEAIKKAKSGKKYPAGDDRNPENQRQFRESNKRRVEKWGPGARI